MNNPGILIVGGAGFVGSNLTRELLKQFPGCHIHIVDNLLSSEEKNIPKDERVSFTKGSITEDRVLKKIEDAYQWIFHIATYHGNQSSIHNPIADHENNTFTTLKLFEKIKEFKNLEKVVYAGAGCAVAKKTYNDAEATKESDICSLTMDSPYSISKIVGEFYSKYYQKQHNLPTIRARFQNVYGPYEVLGAGQWRGTPATVWRNVIPTFIYKALNHEALPLENEGIATRDFIYVEDLVKGLILCADKGTAGDVYNLASGQETSIAELAQLINRYTENPTPPQIKPKREWDTSGKRYGCPEKARKMIGFAAKIKLHEGLKETIAWTKDNLHFIEETIGKHRKKLCP